MLQGAVEVAAAGLYEVSVLRSPAGFCRDAANGHYQLSVLVGGQPVVLTPICDDCP